MSAPGLTNTLISAFDPHIRWVGRVAQSGAGVRLFWSGSGFEVRILGTGLSAAITDPNNRFTLLVDGHVALTCCGPFASGPRPLVSGLTPGEHTVSLLRRSEPLFGETVVSQLIVLDGTLLAPGATRPQLEVVGDSISCGYGNEAAHSDVPFSVHTENHHLTYAAHLARNLAVPLSTIAWSGRGVVRNYADGEGLLIPQMYEQSLPLEQGATPWHFGDTTQLVLINVGTNDFGAPPHPEPETFIEGYVRMLRMVRARRPGTPILCTLGPMLDPEVLRRAQGYIAAAVSRRNTEGDAYVHFYALVTPNHFPATSSHPSLATHAQMAQELLPVVLRVLGST